jgi:tetratricopeptide (TPR) repeat protein
MTERSPSWPILALAALAALVTLGAGRVAFAEDAREHHAEGVKHYRAGEHAAALERFERGYQLDPRPEYLVNMAQCHRALGRELRAVELLEQFVAEAPEHRLRPAVDRTLAELRPLVEPRRAP